MRNQYPVRLFQCLLAGCLFACAVRAQPAHLRFSNFSTRQGLSNNLVNDIIRDSAGFVWTYSSGGISRFDGVAFKNYDFPYHGYDRNNLAVDARGNLWATDGLDLYYFDRKQDRFQQIPIKNAGHQGLAFIHSNGPDRQTWFRETDALYRIDPDTRTVQRLNEGLPHYDQSFNYRDAKGQFWFGMRDAVLRYDPRTQTLSQIPFRDVYAYRFLEAGGEDMWISSDMMGIARLDGEQKTIHTGHGAKSRIACYDLAHCPPFGGDSLIWTNGKYYEGLLAYSKRRQDFVAQYLHDRLNPQSLADNITYKVYTDPEGALWVGNAGGISVAHPRRQDVYRYLFPDEPGNLTPRAVSRDRHAHADDAIVFFDKQQLRYFYNGELRQVNDRGDLGLLKNKYATIFACFDDTGRLWVHTGTGLHRIDRDRGRVAESVILSPAGENEVSPVVSDGLGNLWFTSSTHLKRWNLAAKKLTEFKVLPGDARKLAPGEALETAKADRRGNIWLKTGCDILFFDPKKGKTSRRYSFSHLPVMGRRRLYIQNFTFDNRGHIWLGLNAYLVKVDSLSGDHQLIYLPGVDSLKGGSLRNLLADDEGNIWLSCYSGVYCYQPATGRFLHLDERNDLSSNIVYWIGWADNQILAYHANGMVDIIDPKVALSPLPVPPVYVTEIKILDRTLPLDWTDKSAAPLRLSYRDNILTFRYTAVDFVKPEKITYEYRLDGFDAAWQKAGSRREATYTNLSGGYYTFRVRAINGDGVVSAREAVVSIYVRPPWYATWWFRGLVALAFIALVYAIFRYRELQRLEQEKLRLRIARDLHDEMGSTLSSISILSEAALRNLQADIDRARFGAIGERARQVMEAMSDIVWSVNPRNDSLPNVLQRMKEFAVEILEPQGIALHFEADEAVAALDLPMEQRKDFYLLFKEAVNNAAKYSGASGVWVTVRAENGGLALEVRDNGRGFDPEQVKRGNGLWNMERRAERMGGRFGLESRVGEGTRVKVDM